MLFDWLSVARDVWVGRCVSCGATTRSYACPQCRLTSPLRWELDTIPCCSAAPYAGQLGEHVRRLKYGDETHWAGPLGRLMHVRSASFMAELAIGDDCVLVPVPLHPLRLAERGYNQAALLARALGAAARLRVQTDLMVRKRRTAAQATLDARSRRNNVTQAFEVAKGTTKHVILIDDVATTGSTLRECVLCLTQAGAIVRGVVTVALAGQVHTTT